DPVMVMFPVKNQRGEVEQSRARYIESLNDPNFTVKGKIVAYLRNKDLALVELQVPAPQLPKGITFLPLAAQSPRPGARVHTIGNTGAGGMWSYTEGSVRSVYEKKIAAKLGNGEVLKVEARMIESSNPTNKGDSGGPLVNDEGELVGVTQGGVVDANALSTFIDLSEVKELLTRSRVQVVRRTSTASRTPEKKDTTTASSEVAKSETKVDPREAAAESKLNFAKKAIKVKDFSIAESFLKQIVEDYDDTQAVVEARSLLEEIRKKK
ncbi:MAG TPA: serine protease, partial [Gemmatales bacterium]|nr:serine protease [Gemmatales bacterium]